VISMIPISYLTPDGLIDAPYTANSFAEAAMKEPDGVYTVGRTFRRDQALMLDEHLTRLEESAELEGVPLKLDRARLRAGLRTLIERSGYAESRFRITIPRHDPSTLILSLEPFKPVPPEVLEHGARVITVRESRHNPAAKTTAWAVQRSSAVDAFPPGIYEGILVTDEDVLLEGTSSNFYAIVGGTLRTAGEGVLGGIGRRVLMQVAPAILPVDLRPVKRAEIATFAEAFLTSAGRGVVPIVEIDGVLVGDGHPGASTRKLRDAYNEWADAHLEPI
jgi:branched-chain amino acid aminotransferase